MRLKPNDSPEMEMGEVRRFTFNLSGVTGVNAISSATIEAPNLTFGAPSISDATVTVSCTASKTGTHMAKLTANLASAEKLIGVLRINVKDSTLESRNRDYSEC